MAHSRTKTSLVRATLSALLLTSGLALAAAPAVFAQGTCSITVDKTDTEQSALADAEFTLYLDDGDQTFDAQVDTQIGDPVMTDENGSAGFSGLECGDYFLVETAAPTGFIAGEPLLVQTDIELNAEVVVPVVNELADASPTPEPSATPSDSPTPSPTPTPTPKSTTPPTSTIDGGDNGGLPLVLALFGLLALGGGLFAVSRNATLARR